MFCLALYHGTFTDSWLHTFAAPVVHALKAAVAPSRLALAVLLQMVVREAPSLLQVHVRFAQILGRAEAAVHAAAAMESIPVVCVHTPLEICQI